MFYLGQSIKCLKGFPRSRNNLAFTLIELLVVIAVLGILASLLLPVLAKAKAKGQSAQCISNLKQWGLAWHIYADDSRDRLTPGIGDLPRGQWVQSLKAAYGKKPTLLLCPTATVRRRKGKGREVKSLGADTNVAIFGGPTTAYDTEVEDPTNPGKSMLASYGLNSWAYDPPSNLKKIQGRAATNYWRSLASVETPSIVPLMADSMWRGGGPKTTGKGADRPKFNGEWTGIEYEFKHFQIQRHNRGVEVVFFDGSVSYRKARDLWLLRWHRNFDIDFVNHQREDFFPQWMR